MRMSAALSVCECVVLEEGEQQRCASDRKRLEAVHTRKNITRRCVVSSKCKVGGR
jgi:hypothetical protein